MQFRLKCLFSLYFAILTTASVLHLIKSGLFFFIIKKKRKSLIMFYKCKYLLVKVELED